jgi:hypothetical protein
MHDRRMAMYAWTVGPSRDAHAHMRGSLALTLRVPDWLMARVNTRHRWYIRPD